MKYLYIILFLSVFCFSLNEIFVFGQGNGYNGSYYDSGDAAYRDLISNAEDSYDSDVGRNEAYAFSKEMKLLNYYRNQLANNPADNLESRIGDLQNVLDDTTDMYCTADEDYLNQQLVDLNVAYHQYKVHSNQTQNLLNILNKKENQLRRDIIKAIDNVIKTKGACNNTASELREAENAL